MENPAYFASPGGEGVSQIGNLLSADTIIYPTHRLHHVDGTTVIQTIALDNLWPDFVGPLILLADDQWSWSTLGNITVVGQTIIIGRAYPFWYDRTTAKWYPIGATAAPL